MTDWLEGLGLTVDNGVVCDATLLAAPGIVAAGDVALAQPAVRRRADAPRALDQRAGPGRGAGAGCGTAMRTGAEAFAPVPFVWSDQYDRKIQTAGQFRGDDRMEVRARVARRAAVRGGVQRAGRLVGTLGFSMPAKVMQYRRMIAERVVRGRARAPREAA